MLSKTDNTEVLQPASKDKIKQVQVLERARRILRAVLAGWILLGQALTLRETCGCILMLAAIVLAQLPGRKPEKA